jgi:STAS domain
MTARETLVSETRLSLYPGATQLVVAVRGNLDGPGGRRLCDALRGALAGDPIERRVEVDLSGVDRYTAEGLQELVACTRLGEKPGRRVRIRVGGAAAPPDGL